MEMKMLGWMAGVTRFDRGCIQDIRNRFGVATITDELRESRLRWYGHVLRAGKGTVCKVGFDHDVSGKRARRSSNAALA
ncbi:hypothetical protein Y032_0104g3621 [Ancylostoma ceylanicum]|uniref:Reverse transcriptase domain-containing protein n=1 Tax=Ancylostoma ceylanicum TaxID=53326 RepID=A0A016TGN4_9BILA|nr:hypothetical protein Y032_0104g3621 [Ancylostoma ceylanicum]